MIQVCANLHHSSINFGLLFRTAYCKNVHLQKPGIFKFVLRETVSASNILLLVWGVLPSNNFTTGNIYNTVYAVAVWCHIQNYCHFISVPSVNINCTRCQCAADSSERKKLHGSQIRRNLCEVMNDIQFATLCSHHLPGDGIFFSLV
jgi:hypothetical protein